MKYFVLVLLSLLVFLGCKKDDTTEPEPWGNGVSLQIPQALHNTSWTNEGVAALNLQKTVSHHFTSDDYKIFSPGAVQEHTSFKDLIAGDIAKITLQGTTMSGATLTDGDIYSNIMEYNPAFYSQPPTVNVFIYHAAGDYLEHTLTGYIYTNATNI